jgi:hypothetical protein
LSTVNTVLDSAGAYLIGLERLRGDDKTKNSIIAKKKTLRFGKTGFDRLFFDDIFLSKFAYPVDRLAAIVGIARGRITVNPVRRFDHE